MTKRRGPNTKKRPEELSIMDQCLRALKANGLSITQPRKRIIQVLIDSKEPLTNEAIHRRLGRGVCDLATVYRCMSSFEEVRIVHRGFFDDGTSFYELDMGRSHEDYIICKRCRHTEPIGFCIASDMERLVANRGYKDVSHTLTFFAKECLDPDNCPHNKAAAKASKAK